MLVRPFRFGPAHSRSDAAAGRMAVWSQRHPFAVSFTVCLAALSASVLFEYIAIKFPAWTVATPAGSFVAFFAVVVFALGLVGMPALFQLVGHQRRGFERIAPPVAALVGSIAFAGAHWALSGWTAADDLNLATMFVGCPATWGWAIGFAWRWRWVRAIGRPWLMVAVCAGFSLLGWFIDPLLGIPCFLVLLVWTPLAVHGALAASGRLSWLAWPLVGAGVAISSHIVRGTYFPDPLPMTLGTFAALTLFAPLLSLARVSARLSAVPPDHPIVTDFGVSG